MKKVVYPEIVPKNAIKLFPLKDAPFTLSQIRDCIPKHCFERNLVTSFSYVAKDLLTVALLFYVAANFSSLPLGWSLWPLYWVVQGTVFLGLWVIGHECGHSAFSEYNWVNDTVGMIFHSLLLTPYFAWKFTHAVHHRVTNDLERETGYLPDTRSSFGESESTLKENPLYFKIYQFLAVLIFGMPFYLLFYSASRQTEGVFSSHFRPFPIYKQNQYAYIYLSNAGILTALTIFGYFIGQYGWINFINFYFIPYCVCNAWFIFYTFLHHNDKKIPHYETNEWSYIRGALSTIDRPYGIFNYFHHEIGSTHVCHHLFSKLPFYHAREATQHLKRFLGEYYNETDENVFISLWNEYTFCKFVEDTGSIRYFKNFGISPNTHLLASKK